MCDDDIKVKLNVEECKRFMSIFIKLRDLFLTEGYYGKEQAIYIQSILNLIDDKNLEPPQEKIDRFVKEINSVEMWGGSGAVCEFGFENKETKREFNKEMFNLICLMKDKRILGARAVNTPIDWFKNKSN